MDIRELEQKSCEIRLRLLRMIYESGTGHTGGALSSVDILTVLYYHIMHTNPKYPNWKDRDLFLLSKGHSVEGLYCILADLGFFPDKELETFSAPGSILIGHPNNKVPGVEVNTGALGHGLPIGTGMAIAIRRDGADNRVFVLMGDGEQAEGSVWEAAMAAANYKLDNLYGIIDRNGLQISGTTEQVMALEDLNRKWSAFGWQVLECDGNDISALCKTFTAMEQAKGTPKLLIAHTVKGKGISFMEQNVKWHHGVPDAAQYNKAIKELSTLQKELVI